VIVKSLRKVVTRAQLAVKNGDVMPPWYYGLAYQVWDAECVIFYPIPLNLIVRTGMYLKYRWDRWRSKPTYIDIQIQKGIQYFFDRQEIERRKRVAMQNLMDSNYHAKLN
jgi:hypothetical protein